MLGHPNSINAPAAAGLHPFQEYSYQVQAGNSAGFGDWSNTASVRTAPAAPSAPTNLQAQGEKFAAMHVRCIATRHALAAAKCDQGAQVLRAIVLRFNIMINNLRFATVVAGTHGCV